MITDPTVSLRAEITAAIDVLDPQLRGISDWLLIPISPELRHELILEGEDRGRRRLLLGGVIEACDRLVLAIENLDKDDYPVLKNREISSQLLSELKSDDSDINKAADLFEMVPQATGINVALGNPADK